MKNKLDKAADAVAQIVLAAGAAAATAGLGGAALSAAKDPDASDSAIKSLAVATAVAGLGSVVMIPKVLEAAG